MNILAFIIFVCVIVFLLMVVLPLLFPVILFLFLLAIIATVVFVWKIKRKIKKGMNVFEENWSKDDMDSFDMHSTSPNNEDVFDVEFTEREDTDK